MSTVEETTIKFGGAVWNALADYLNVEDEDLSREEMAAFVRVMGFSEPEAHRVRTMMVPRFDALHDTERDLFLGELHRSIFTVVLLVNKVFLQYEQSRN